VHKFALNPNLASKITIFFNVKYLENGTRYSYGRLIGSRVWSIEWWYSEWSCP